MLDPVRLEADADWRILGKSAVRNLGKDAEPLSRLVLRAMRTRETADPVGPAANQLRLAL
jgi:hypothetical protein